MSLFNRLWRGGPGAPEAKAAPAIQTARTDAELARFFASGRQTRAGVIIKLENAMEVPAFAGAVRLIGEALAVLPAQIVEVDDAGTRNVVRTDPRRRLLDFPNSYQSWPEFVLAMQTEALLAGRAFALVNRVDGQAREILPLPRGAVTRTFPLGALVPEFTLTEQNGRRRILQRSDLVVIECVGGRGLVAILRETLGLATSINTHIASTFGKGMRPSGYLTPTSAIGPVAEANMRAAFQAMYSGPENAGGTMLLPPGIKFEQATLTSTDMQAVELWRHVILEIARAARVSPFQLGALERATYSNFASAARDFVQNTLLFWVRMWEGALELALFSPEERARFEVELNFDELVRADFLPRMQALAAAVNAGLFTPNEARGTEGRPPLQGGDELRVSTNSMPAITTTEPTDPPEDNDVR